MLTDVNINNIYFYKGHIDMRKGINGISILIANHLGRNPQSGDLYIFSNRVKDKIKCLFWHNNGFAILYKQLESGRLKFCKEIDDEIVITHQQLSALLMGFDFTKFDKKIMPKYENY